MANPLITGLRRKGCKSHMMLNGKSHPNSNKKSQVKSNQEADSLEAHWFLITFSANSQNCWPWHDIAFGYNQFNPSPTSNYSLNTPKTHQVLFSSVLVDCQDWYIWDILWGQSLIYNLQAIKFVSCHYCRVQKWYFQVCLLIVKIDL